MAQRFGIRGTSPIHCTLHKNSTAAYDVTTSFCSPSVTSVIRDGTVIAKIEWSKIGRWRSKVTIEGQAGVLDNILPRTGMFTQSREYRSIKGKVLKWKVGGISTLCIAPDTNTNLAHYNGVPITRSIKSRETSILEVFDGAQDIQDAIVVTWAIMEIMARGRNPASTPGIRNSTRPGQRVLRSGGDGGSWGSFGGGGGDGGCGGDGGGGGG
ncbi:unnamed protein product [Rhizoctonia solani]|uniref:DUF6593 domain-containing protein n=1 Tax=Rhizoctonia solani TaxID=456999 RepID=A0A8H3DPR9_9AGAM|nr:unnamed protein product [Rhizoctonia solani]